MHEIHPYVVPLHHQLHDWLAMASIALAFAVPEIVALARRRRWRRDVFAACR